MREKSITVLLADDHPLVRKGLREVIEERGDYVVAAEAGNGEEALRLIGELRPDIAVLDVEMPRMSGLEVARKVHEKELAARIVILTMYDQPAVFYEALDAGVLAYVLKDSAMPEVLDALDTVARGEYYLSPSLTDLALRRKLRTETSAEIPGLNLLTQTERQVLRHLSGLESNRRIAEKLFISVRTVEHHRYNMSRKLGISGTHALVRFAVEHRDEL